MNCWPFDKFVKPLCYIIPILDQFKHNYSNNEMSPSYWHKSREQRETVNTKQLGRSKQKAKFHVTSTNS